MSGRTRAKVWLIGGGVALVVASLLLLVYGIDTEHASLAMSVAAFGMAAGSTSILVVTKFFLDVPTGRKNKPRERPRC